MGMGKDIASKLPPPDQLDDVMPESPMEDTGEGGEESEMAAAKASAMEGFSSALKSGSIEDKVAAFEALMEACSPTKGY